MSAIALGLNLLLAALLAAALAMGWRLNRRLKSLRESQAGFAQAVAELNAAAARAEKGLSELRAASDEAMDLLSDRIKKGRELAARLETLAESSPALRAQPAAERRPAAPPEDVLELDRPRLGALLSEAQRRRAAQATTAAPREERPLTLSRRSIFDEDLFEADERPTLGALGGRR